METNLETIPKLKFNCEISTDPELPSGYYYIAGHYSENWEPCLKKDAYYAILCTYNEKNECVKYMHCRFRQSEKAS